MRIVADTAVLVRMNVKAAGPARLVLERIAGGPHELVLSTFLLQEVERVLNYPRMQALYALTPAEIREQIEQFVSVAQILDPIVREPVVLNDPDDATVIYTAVDGQADILCTLDRHFYAPGVIEFCRNHGISVMNDIELLRSL
ncbi:MAG TPA: putative toxin-antitoxin system toxin component, PIN family [Bryobacteraceae bacterium]|nr:putative toxin-antitoxin system toxin component, PIN family [Bryobacteraceae bacterium]